MARWWRARGRTLDRGAAAVEFALVMPLLLLLFVGIVDYGRYFFDSVSLRQGAREAARQAVVQRYGSCTTGTTGEKIACAATAATNVTLGTPVVHIPAITGTGGWKQRNQLIVCMASLEQPTGLVPFPTDRTIKTKAYMSIEVDSTPISDYQYGTGADPSGLNWSWCPL